MEETQQRVRPESIAARNFSDDLDSLFGLHSGSTLGHLSSTVQEKKRNVSTQAEELAALEARIKEAEERLARAAAGRSESPAASGGASAASEQEQATSDTQPSFPPRTQSAQATPPPTYQTYRGQAPPQPSVRPPNPPREESFTPHIPGAMPRTPTPRYGPGNDYVTVDRTR